MQRSRLSHIKRSKIYRKNSLKYEICYKTGAIKNKLFLACFRHSLLPLPTMSNQSTFIKYNDFAFRLFQSPLRLRPVCCRKLPESHHLPAPDCLAACPRRQNLPSDDEPQPDKSRERLMRILLPGRESPKSLLPNRYM